MQPWTIIQFFFAKFNWLPRKCSHPARNDRRGVPLCPPRIWRNSIGFPWKFIQNVKYIIIYYADFTYKTRRASTVDLRAAQRARLFRLQISIQRFFVRAVYTDFWKYFEFRMGFLEFNGRWISSLILYTKCRAIITIWQNVTGGKRVFAWSYLTKRVAGEHQNFYIFSLVIVGQSRQFINVFFSKSARRRVIYYDQCLSSAIQMLWIKIHGTYTVIIS